MASNSELRLIRPTPRRNAFYQLVIVLVSWLSTGFVWLAPAVLNVLLFVFAMLLFLLVFTLTASSLAALPTLSSDEAKRAKFAFVHRPSHRLNVLISGAGVGPELFTAAPIGDEPEAGSYASVFAANGEALLLVGLPIVYDEAVFFEQLHQIIARSRYGLVSLHLHSMSALMLDRFTYWMYEEYPAWKFHIEAVHLISPAFRLRPLQRLLLVLFRPYLGGPILQWLWSNGLNRIVWHENPIDQGQCDDDGRTEVYQLIRRKMDTVNVDRLLGNMSVMFRGSQLSRRREAPLFRLMVTEWVNDEVVDPAANRKILERRFDGCVEYNPIEGNEVEVGSHGEAIAFFPRVSQLAARRFIRLRDDSNTSSREE